MSINYAYPIFSYNIEEARIFSENEMLPYELDRVNGLVKIQKEQNELFFNIKIKKKPEIYFCASVKSFEEKTDLDWHYGGFCKNGKIYLQPLKVLERKNNLEQIIFHEYTHFFIEQVMPGLPHFINEGLTAFLAGNICIDNPPMLYENLINPDNFLNPMDFEYFLSSSMGFVKQLISKMGKEGFLEFLKKASTNEIKDLYQHYYNESCDKVRVWINPRGEKRFNVIFKEKCEVVSQGGKITNVFNENIFLEAINNSLYLNNITDSEFTLYFQNGFTTDNGIDKSKSYRGNLKVYLTNQTLYLINIIPVEEYLYSVVASEMPSTNIEALKVQAVLSRSLVLFKKKLRKSELYDVLSLTSDQSYQGRNWETTFSIEAVQKTDREVLFYNNNLIYPYYSSTCGGHTALSFDVWNKKLPYIKSVECIISNEFLCEKSPHFKDWERVITGEELSEIMGFRIYNFQIENTNQYGRVKYIKINDRIFLFDELKSILSKKKGWAFLKSNLIKVEKSSDGLAYIIKGKGLGHGIGLCQYGAIRLAENKNYKKIISFYFNNVEIKKIGYKYNLYPDY